MGGQVARGAGRMQTAGSDRARATLRREARGSGQASGGGRSSVADMRDRPLVRRADARAGNCLACHTAGLLIRGRQEGRVPDAPGVLITRRAHRQQAVHWFGALARAVRATALSGRVRARTHRLPQLGVRHPPRHPRHGHGPHHWPRLCQTRHLPHVNSLRDPERKFAPRIRRSSRSHTPHPRRRST